MLGQQPSHRLAGLGTHAQPVQRAFLVNLHSLRVCARIVKADHFKEPPIARSLEACEDVRVAPYARNDELRLLVVPRLAMPGVVGIEVAVAWERAGGATLPTYEALVRVQDGSFAAAKMAAYAEGQRCLPGRKPEERVYRFEPAGPSNEAAVALVVDLADALRDRRMIVATRAEWEGAERRLPPNVRRALGVA